MSNCAIRCSANTRHVNYVEDRLRNALGEPGIAASQLDTNVLTRVYPLPESESMRRCCATHAQTLKEEKSKIGKLADKVKFITTTGAHVATCCNSHGHRIEARYGECNTRASIDCEGEIR